MSFPGVVMHKADIVSLSPTEKLNYVNTTMKPIVMWIKEGKLSRLIKLTQMKHSDPIAITNIVYKIDKQINKSVK